MNKKILLISLISLMFIIFISSFVNASSYEPLKITNISYSGDSIVFTDPNTLVINYSLSNLKNINYDAHKINNSNDVAIMVYYFKEPLTDIERSNLDLILSEKIYKYDDFVTACSNLNLFIRKLNIPNLTLENSYCNSKYASLDLTIDIKNEFKNKSDGAFYVYLLEYKVDATEVVVGSVVSTFFNLVMSLGSRSYSTSDYIGANILLDSVKQDPSTQKYSWKTVDNNNFFTKNYFATSKEYMLSKFEDTVTSEESSEDVKKPSDSIVVVQNVPTIKLSPVNKSGPNYFCTESNICYFNDDQMLDDFKINVSGTTQSELKFYTDILTQSNLDSIKDKFNTPIDQLRTIINLSLGSYNDKFSITNNNQFVLNGVLPLSENYFISVGLDNVNFDKIYFINLPESDYNSLIQFNIYKKIINEVYCPGCEIPDWMPGGVILDTPVPQDLTPVDEDCTYPDPYKVLCDFYLFDLNNKINTSTVNATGVGVTMTVKDTFFLELKDKYITKNIDVLKNNSNVKLFFSELNNFGLSENEQKIFFSIIGGESSFNPIALGDSGKSFGFVQLNESWNKQSSFDQIKQYLPVDKRDFTTYQKYFTDYTHTDANYSLYLGLAVFKYHLAIMKNTTVMSYDVYYTGIENAFMQFYKHQLSSNYAETFFNKYNISKTLIIDCKSNPTQKVAENRLECVSTIGSVRKMAWYVFADNNWVNLKAIK